MKKLPVFPSQFKRRKTNVAMMVSSIKYNRRDPRPAIAIGLRICGAERVSPLFYGELLGTAEESDRTTLGSDRLG